MQLSRDTGRRCGSWRKVEDELDLAAAGFARVININGFLRDGENPLDKAVAERNLRESISAALQ